MAIMIPRICGRFALAQLDVFHMTWGNPEIWRDVWMFPKKPLLGVKTGQFPEIERAIIEAEMLGFRAMI